MKDDLALDKSTDATDAFMVEHELGASLLAVEKPKDDGRMHADVRGEKQFPEAHESYGLSLETCINLNLCQLRTRFRLDIILTIAQIKNRSSKQFSQYFEQ